MPESTGLPTPSSRESPLRRAARAIRLLHRQLREERAANAPLRMVMELASVRGLDVTVSPNKTWETGVARIPLPHLRMGWDFKSAGLRDLLVEIDGVPHLVVELFRAYEAKEGA